MDIENRNNVILIPSYEPDETLFYLVRGLYNHNFNIVVVDDGSGEKYDEIFDSILEFAIVLRYETNRGKGYALKYGFGYIKDNFKDKTGVITADGDGQHTILDICKVSEILFKEKKTVLGLRAFEGKIPIKSKIGNDMSRFTQTLATYRYLSDNQCGLRGFLIEDIDFLLSIKGDRYEYEMKVITSLQLKEIPYETISIETIYEDNNSKSHFKPLLDTFLIQKSILLAGLINFISLIVEAVICILLFNFAFKDTIGNYALELSIIIGFFSSIFFKCSLHGLLYRPKYFQKVILKQIIYGVFLLVAIFVSVNIFYRILGLDLYLAYIFNAILIVFPLYYLIKGVGVVYESQRG